MAAAGPDTDGIEDIGYNRSMISRSTITCKSLVEIRLTLESFAIDRKDVMNIPGEDG